MDARPLTLFSSRIPGGSQSAQRLQPAFLFCLLILLQLICRASVGSASTNSTTTKDDLCTCPCGATPVNVSQDVATTITEARSKADTIEKELTIEKNTTSFFTRAKLSIQDDRPSAKSLGVLGIAFMSAIFAAIFLLDVATFIIDMTSKVNNGLPEPTQSEKVDADGGMESSSLEAGNVKVTGLLPSAQASEIPEVDYSSTSSVIGNDYNHYLNEPLPSWLPQTNNAPISTQERHMNMGFSNDFNLFQTVRSRTSKSSHVSESEA